MDFNIKPSVITYPDKNITVHSSAYVDNPNNIGEGTKVWHFSHIEATATIGTNCTIGQNVYIGNNVKICNNCKIQNNVSIFEGVTLEDYVFIGPSVTFTNVSNPRSEINRKNLYETTIVKRGASIGANSTIICGIELGCYSFVAAGSVVKHNVGDFVLVKGVPAKFYGYMTRHGHKFFPRDEEIFTCPESGLRYKVCNDYQYAVCLDYDNYAELTEELRLGTKPYSSFKV